MRACLHQAHPGALLDVAKSSGSMQLMTSLGFSHSPAEFSEDDGNGICRDIQGCELRNLGSVLA